MRRRLRPYVPHPGPRRKPPRSPEGNVLPGDWITPSEAAKLLGVGERTIRRRCRTGALRGYDFGLGYMVDRGSLPSPKP